MTNEKCFEVHAELVVRPTGQDVDDIMVSALEGGMANGPSTMTHSTSPSIASPRKSRTK